MRLFTDRHGQSVTTAAPPEDVAEVLLSSLVVGDRGSSGLVASCGKSSGWESSGSGCWRGCRRGALGESRRAAGGQSAHCAAQRAFHTGTGALERAGWSILILRDAATITMPSTQHPSARERYHIAGVYDSGAQTLTLYVNGASDVTGYRPITGGGLSLYWGRETYAGHDLAGTLDDSRVYSRALSAPPTLVTSPAKC